MCLSVIGRSSVGVPTYQNVKTSRPWIISCFCFVFHQRFLFVCFCFVVFSFPRHPQTGSLSNVSRLIFRVPAEGARLCLFSFCFGQCYVYRRFLHSRLVSQRRSYVYVYCWIAKDEHGVFTGSRSCWTGSRKCVPVDLRNRRCSSSWYSCTDPSDAQTPARPKLRRKKSRSQLNNSNHLSFSLFMSLTYRRDERVRRNRRTRLVADGLPAPILRRIRPWWPGSPPPRFHFLRRRWCEQCPSPRNTFRRPRLPAE